ncbi:putative variant ionotropic glutamate receptor-like 27 [Homarus americanus]|uniref:Putative variant ionotropic glutamate receptor-like 27 n=1 Tax=Homarus americanus TaxID=6706 RepID=A0A8J5JPY4_HOMAM|nr:putative variant ionotropic glutamate receptor-like 27 [Homarus americanus]
MEMVLVGWWLVFCLVITTGLRSSHIAHFTVQGKILPLDTFEDKVGRSNWTWGIETWILNGVDLMITRQNKPALW